MSETMERSAGQGAQFEMPVSKEAQAAGVRGAIVERRSPGLFGETMSTMLMKTLFHARPIEETSHGAAEQTVNQTGLGPVTEQERAQHEARKQERKQAQIAREQADRRQTEQSLDNTRSELQREIAAQEAAAKPPPQDGNERVKQPTEAKTQESDTELRYLVSSKDGSRIPFTVPKNATLQESTAAIRALGGNFADYEAVYTWTPQGVNARFKGMWHAVKKAFQASAPPAAG